MTRRAPLLLALLLGCEPARLNLLERPSDAGPQDTDTDATTSTSSDTNTGPDATTSTTSDMSASTGADAATGTGTGEVTGCGLDWCTVGEEASSCKQAHFCFPADTPTSACSGFGICINLEHPACSASNDPICSSGDSNATCILVADSDLGNCLPPSKASCVTERYPECFQL